MRWTLHPRPFPLMSFHLDRFSDDIWWCRDFRHLLIFKLNPRCPVLFHESRDTRFLLRGLDWRTRYVRVSTPLWNGRRRLDPDEQARARAKAPSTPARSFAPRRRTFSYTFLPKPVSLLRAFLFNYSTSRRGWK